MKVGIVGGGFAGLSAAIAFTDDGHDVTVFERSEGPSPAGGAISLARNGLACLSMLGVRDMSEAGRWADVEATVRSPDGRVLVRSTLARLTGGGQYAAVPRGELLAALSELVRTDCVRYASPVSSVGVDGTIQLCDVEERFDLVVGADGAGGSCRRSLWPDAPTPRRTATVDWAWIVDAELSSGFGSIWGRTAQFGVLPVAGGRTYVYGGSCERGVTLSSFRHWPSPLPDLIDAADPARIITPAIVEARPPRRLQRGKVVLIGDAAHAMQPTFGQGVALAMEDALTLAAGGTAALSRRWVRMLALYGVSKGGAYFSMPRWAALELARNVALRVIPDGLFGSMAGSVSRWSPVGP